MTRAEHFDKVALKYGTDKASEGCEKPHNYMQYYAKHLPNNPRKLLEIGCAAGKSLRMWRELFPDCELHTLDLFEEHKEPTDIEGLICHKGNQNNLYTLNAIGVFPFDVIIDDGSHNAMDMHVSFQILFNDSLTKKGVYVIEDLHCLKSKYFLGDMPFDKTILGLMISGNFPHRFDLYEEKIAFIYK